MPTLPTLPTPATRTPLSLILTMPLPTTIRASAPPPSASASANSSAWIAPIIMITTIFSTGLLIPIQMTIAGVTTLFLASEMTQDTIGAILCTQPHGSRVQLITGAMSMSTVEKSITEEDSSTGCSHRPLPYLVYFPVLLQYPPICVS
ncbi:hypothetical protein EV363DRAFT_1314261 [Boletus edulis]|nr:hypothetical protein EV363DRAFT_1314261 [Boletus edulis]